MIDYVCLTCGVFKRVDDPLDLPQGDDLHSHEFELVSDVQAANAALHKYRCKTCGNVICHKDPESNLCNDCLSELIRTCPPG